MAARPHDTTRAEMALIRNAKKRHGKAKNGAYGRSCGIAQLGTDQQGDGTAWQGKASSGSAMAEMGSETSGGAAERLGVERTRGDKAKQGRAWKCQLGNA